MQSFIQDFMLREGRNIFYFYATVCTQYVQLKKEMSDVIWGGGKGEFRLGGGEGGLGHPPLCTIPYCTYTYTKYRLTQGQRNNNG